jgi:hypothetical protein
MDKQEKFEGTKEQKNGYKSLVVTVTVTVTGVKKSGRSPVSQRENEPGSQAIRPSPLGLVQRPLPFLPQMDAQGSGRLVPDQDAARGRDGMRGCRFTRR